MTVQEARTARCAELQESEVAYSEALSEAAAKKSHECATLHQMHAEHMQDLEAQAIRAKNRSCQDFLLAHQTLLHRASHSVKEESYSSYSLLLGPYSPFLQHVPFTPASQAEVNPSLAASTATLSNRKLDGLPHQKGGVPLKMHRKTHLVMKTFLLSQRKNVQMPNEGRWPTGKPP